MTTLSALTMPVRRVRGSSLRPLPWRRMAWVTWRQHRPALIGVAALLGALALGLWIAGLRLHNAYDAAIACHPASSSSCGELALRFNGADDFLTNGLMLQAVPALIGAFVGAPVLARELERGTFRFAWTQGFGRWRWTLAKLAALGVVLAGAAGVLGVLISWYFEPYFATSNQTRALAEWSPLSPNSFDLRGIAFAAWTLTAFAIGGLAGMLIRRIVPAIAVTLATYVGLAFATGLYLRPHYLTPLVATKLKMPGSTWIISQQWRTQGGQLVSSSVLGQVLQGAAPQLAGKGDVPRSLGSWQYLAHHGYALWTTYQPASRFWPFQLIEGGWLLALSAVLIATTVWLVRRQAT